MLIGAVIGTVIGAVVGAASSVVQAAAPVVSVVVSAGSQVLDATTGIPSMISDVQTIFSGKASFLDKVLAVGDLALNVAMDVSMVVEATDLTPAGDARGPMWYSWLRNIPA